MPQHVFFRAVILALACFLAWPALAGAAAVTVSVPVEEGVGAKEREAKAQAEAFAQGIAAEAQSLLPSPLDPERAAALAEVLRPRAADFVMGYSEISRQETPEMLTLSMEVKANRPELKRHLERLGLYAGLAGRRPVRLAVGGAARPEDLARLQALGSVAGLANVPGSSISLRFLAGADHVWSGVLDDGSERVEEHNPNLDVVFMRLLGRMLAREPAPAATGEKLVLSVWGWSAPDGARDFDRTLHSWNKAAADTVLSTLTVRSEGVAASWELSGAHREALEGLLPDYLGPRGLSYNLTPAGS